MADTSSSVKILQPSSSGEMAETAREPQTGTGPELNGNLIADSKCVDRSQWVASSGAKLSIKTHEQSGTDSDTTLRVTFDSIGNGGLYSKAITASGLKNRKYEVSFKARGSHSGIRLFYQMSSRTADADLKLHPYTNSQITASFTEISDVLELEDADVYTFALRIFVRSSGANRWFEITDVELRDVTDDLAAEDQADTNMSTLRRQPQAASIVEVAPAARPASMQARHWLMLFSFIFAVILPTAISGYYLYGYANDQYASKVGFTVRKEETGSGFEMLGGLTNISGASSSDTDILYHFIQSQELVQAVDTELDLQKLYTKPENDPIFSLKPDATIEELVDYWLRMVRIVYDPGTGLIEVETRSFSAQDSQNIAAAIFRRSSAMINELSAIARADLTRYAKEELDQAVVRLKEARQAMTLFRNETQIVDPGADIQGQMGLLNSLQAQMAETLIEQDLLRETARTNDPRLEQARLKVEVIRKRISEERRKLGVSGEGDTRVFADLVGEYESLLVDREFAEKTYLSALLAYDTAVAEARRQSRYLAAYVRPTLAETPLYPQREILLALTLIILFGIWSIVTLVYYSLKDRR